MINLNRFSQRFADVLFAKYPEYESYAATDEDGEGSLVVEIPLPHSPDDVLYILTENDEVTIGVTGWHDHYGTWTGATEAEAWAEAFEFLEDFLAERLVIVATQVNKEWSRSWPAKPGEELHHHPLTPNEDVVVRSWGGTYNKEIPAGA